MSGKPQQASLLFKLDSTFKSQAKAVAVVYDGKSYTYAELEALSHAISALLIEQGLTPGQIVGIYLDNRYKAIASIIAILNMGCTYLPLDPVYPRNRLEYMVENSGTRYVLTDMADAAYASVTTIDLSKDITTHHSLKPARVIEPELAYIIYTSGSTGKPKGVMMRYSVLSNLISWQNNQYPAGQTFRTAQFSQLSFDVSFQEIFSTLCAGGTLLLLQDHVKRDFKALLNHLVENNVERIFMPYIALLHLAQWACRLKTFPASLLHVVTAGEQLIISDEIREFFQHCKNARLYNQYGPSETHVVTEYVLPLDVNVWPDIPPIGKPIDKAVILLLDDQLHEVTSADAGEIYIAGEVLAKGYINNPDETQKRFVEIDHRGKKIQAYKTGDIATIDAAGNFLYKDRSDNQIKINGYRVELSEVEAQLLNCEGISQVAVSPIETRPGQKALVAFVVMRDGSAKDAAAIQLQLGKTIPDYMIPKQIIVLSELEKTPSGKIDRRGMIERHCNKVPENQQKTKSNNLQQAHEIICDELNISPSEDSRSLVDLGMDSMAANRIAARFFDDLKLDVPAYQLFQYKSVRSFLKSLDTEKANQVQSSRKESHQTGKDIAIIGMSLAVPGANDLEQFWDNLVNGRESITFFEQPVANSDRVNVRGLIDYPTEFDASFFGIRPIEAEFIDPQQRQMLEQAWHALEDAGIVPDSFSGRIGVFCGVGNNTYYLNNVLKNSDKLDAYGDFQAMIANEKDYTATRISHKLNLNGPSLNILTACSTSLVAVAEAVQSLREGACDIALAGAAALTFPQQQPYQYQEGGIFSRDGHTRAFDENSNGTIFSDGCGIVVLKRLDYAISDRDHIYAVIKGAAINNDGAEKGSFSAPSIEGQKNVILSAMIDANIEARNISYIEAHGTATPLGDPIEVAALKDAFKVYTQEKNFCGIGSVKSNIGHLTPASGVVGLIKTALMVNKSYLVPSINFKTPNQALGLEASPFYINHVGKPWLDAHRIAGVSSFGIGGTNAHVIIGGYSSPAAGQHASIFKLPLCISAKNAPALQAYLKNYQAYFENNDFEINDVAASILNRRQAFDYRCSLAAIDCISSAARMAPLVRSTKDTKPFRYKNLVYLFPGQGTQTLGMGRYLYEHVEPFKTHFDACANILLADHQMDIRDIIENKPDELTQTACTQPALFSICYSLAQMMAEFDIRPTHTFGHSIGELVSATLANVFDLSTALKVVVVRGRVMQAQPHGDMLAAHASAEQLQPYLDNDVVIGAYNSAESCVLSGSSDSIAKITAKLASAQIECKPLRTSHAFHSPLMDGAVNAFLQALKDVKLNAPRIPFISCVTGDWITNEQAQDLQYWAQQIVRPVQFYQGCLTLKQLDRALLIEMGPRQVLTGLILQNLAEKEDIRYLQAMNKPGDSENELLNLSAMLGKLWEYGGEPEWSSIISSTEFNFVRLPVYPFQRSTYKIEPADYVAQPTVAEQRVNQFNQTLNQTYVSTGMTLDTTAMNNSLIEKLKSLLSDASGLDLSSADDQASFFELGLDSLFLTQAALQIKREFKVAVTFRQLLNEYGSFSGLAKYLKEQGVNVQPAAATPVAVQTAPTPAAIPVQMPMQQPNPVAVMPVSNFDSTGLTGLLSQQIQLINSQMQLLTQAMANQGSGFNQPVAVHQPALAAAPAATSAAQQKPAEEEPRRMPFGAAVRINVKRSNEMTAKQQKHYDELSARYINKHKKSKLFAQANRQRLADPRVASGFRTTLKEIIFPIVVEKSQGPHLWDIDGNKFIDITCGFGSNFFGNGADFIREAVEKQLKQGYEIGPQNPLVADVSKRFCDMTGHERVAFCNTGSEAVLGAVRLARTVTAKDKVVMFDGDYHGINDEVIVHRTSTGVSKAAAAGIPQSAVSETIILDYGQDHSLDYIRANADEIGAVLVEPVQSRNPELQPKEFLHKLRAICTENDIAMIFDEVITGLRLQAKGAQGYFGVTADLATYGKVIGGGMPIGVIAGKKEYMDALDGGQWQYGDDSSPEVGVTYFAGTFVRHPLALAAANAVLKKLEANPGIQDELNARTAAMVKILNEYCKSVGAPIKIPHCGSLFKIKIPQDISYEELIYVLLREKGIHIWDARPCFLTTSHTEAEINAFIKAFKASVDEMLDMDFLPCEKPAASKKAFDSQKPPVPGARLGKDPKGNPAWYVEDEKRPGKYLQVEAAG